MKTEQLSDSSHRTITGSVAQIVADFEMFNRDVVSVEDIAESLGVAADSRRVKDAVHALVRRGWLRPLAVRGAYEFLAARGGPYPGGDPLTEARAARRKRPDFRLAIVGTGAAFLRGFSERAPRQYDIAVDREQGGSVALARSYDVVKTTAKRLAGRPDLRDVPVSDAAHLLADAALWPTTAGDLRDISHWLARSLDDTEPAAAVAVALQVGTAAAARMAYLAARFDAMPVSAAIAATLRGRARTSIGQRSAPIVVRDAVLGVDDRVGVATLG